MRFKLTKIQHFHINTSKVFEDYYIVSMEQLKFRIDRACMEVRTTNEQLIKEFNSILLKLGVLPDVTYFDVQNLDSFRTNAAYSRQVAALTEHIRSISLQDYNRLILPHTLIHKVNKARNMVEISDYTKAIRIIHACQKQIHSTTLILNTYRSHIDPGTDFFGCMNYYNQIRDRLVKLIKLLKIVRFRRKLTSLYRVNSL